MRFTGLEGSANGEVSLGLSTDGRVARSPELAFDPDAEGQRRLTDRLRPTPLLRHG